MPDAPFFTTRVDRGVTIIELGPRAKLIEEPILDDLTKGLLAAIAAAPAPVVVLDLTQTTFFGSSFIETMFRMWKSLNSRPNAQFALCGVYKYCREVLDITNLDKMWPIYADQKEAVAAMATA
jgi:anti-sigma B factor antagonist